MDILVLKERIQKTIELGESQFREFKSALQGEPSAKSARALGTIAKDIAEALVAFANADGGELLIGVEDDGTITGVPFDETRIATLLKAPITGVFSETPLPSPIATKVSFDDKLILYFAVDKSTRTIHQTSDGRCLQRRDLESVPVAATRLQFERQEQLSREYDRQLLRRRKRDRPRYRFSEGCFRRNRSYVAREMPSIFGLGRIWNGHLETAPCSPPALR